MLYWLYRNLTCLVSALFRAPLTVDAVVTKRFIANIFDTDWFRSIQAGQFFVYTDAARWELAVRLGLLKASFKHKWVIILGAQKIIHRKPVKLFRFFSITMKITGWDDKWIYVAHVFRQADQTKCVSFSKIGLRQHGRLVHPGHAMRLMGHRENFAVEPWVLRHFESDMSAVDEAPDQLLEQLRV